MPLTTRGVQTAVSVLAICLAVIFRQPQPLATPPLDVGSLPNILIIITDDQRSDSMKVMPATRRIFKRNGTGYANAFATTPVCCPSRASILTGRYVHNHGLEGDYNDDGFEPRKEEFHRTTLQSLLQPRGYLTGIFGKYLNGWSLAEDPPNFDRWMIMEKETYVDSEVNDQGDLETLARYSTSAIRAKSLEFIRDFAEQRDENPWFLYVAPVAPHEPATPERRYEGAEVPRFRPPPSFLEADRSDKPPFMQERSTTRRKVLRDRADQLRTLMSVDDLVARLFEALEATGETRRTLAAFISDNGVLWGEHHLDKKAVPYIEAVRVPFFLRWPGRIIANATDDRLVANIDLAPTVLDAAGIEAQTELDGRSLLDEWDRDRLLLEYFLFGTSYPWASILTPGYQYSEHYRYEGVDAYPHSREYYDLAADPWQLENLLGDDDTRNDPDVEALHQRLRQDRLCRGQSCP